MNLTRNGCSNCLEPTTLIQVRFITRTNDMRDTVGENLEKNHGNLGDIKIKVSKSKEYLKTGAQVFINISEHQHTKWDK